MLQVRTKVQILKSVVLLKNFKSFKFVNKRSPIGGLFVVPLIICLTTYSVLAEETKPTEENALTFTAVRGLSQQSEPLTQTASFVTPEQPTFSPESLSELLESIEGLSINGKGGLFQSLSVRGISGQRVLYLIEGIPIFTERRAGATLSFLDPALLSGAMIIKGPVSTWYGSGALGGVIDAKVKSTGHELINSWQTTDDEFLLAANGHSNEHAFGAAYRAANDSETAEGKDIHTGYEQTSAYWKSSTDWQELHIESFLAVSKGNDIGKSDPGFPEDRVTDYPTEQHLLGKVSVELREHWRLSVFAHNNELRTEVLRPAEELSVVDNRSRDIGIQWQQQSHWGSFEQYWGIDWLYRSDVSAVELNRDLQRNSMTASRTLDKGRLDERAVFYSQTQHVDEHAYEWGLRFTWQEQNSEGFQAIADEALTGFIGGMYEIDEQWRLKANIGTGFRFPTLTERFYTGTTGRGQVIGNPLLEPERSLAFELGAVFETDEQSFELNLFEQRVRDYIERVSLGDDTRTYRNLTEGTIEGVELLYKLTSNEQQWWIGSSYLNGDSNAGEPLADVPGHRSRVGYQYQGQHQQIKFELEYRISDSDVADGERITPEAWLADIAWTLDVNQDLSLGVAIQNLFDERYYPSADEDMTLAPGRQAKISMRLYF